MIRTNKRKPKSASSGYAGLITQFPLRSLHEEFDYDNALKMAEALVGLVNLSDDQADHHVLTDIIQKYESRRHSIGGQSTPLDTLERMVRSKASAERI